MTEKTAVHTPTKEEYDRLMVAFEKKGWKWLNWWKPTKERDFESRWKAIYILFCNHFYSTEIPEDYTIITVDEAIAKLGLYERGQEVLVSDTGQNWFNAIYLCTIDWSTYPYHVVYHGNEENFRKWDIFATVKYQFIKPLEPTTLELTMKDIEDKFGCPVKIIKEK